MSKRFDTTLFDALDLVSGSVRGEGAAAARKRGRQRTVRRRITASAVSIVLMAGGTTVAFKAASPHGARPGPSPVASLTSADGPHDPTRIIPEAMLTAAEFPAADTDHWHEVKTFGEARNEPRMMDLKVPGENDLCYSLRGGIVGQQVRLFDVVANSEALPGQYYNIYPTPADAADAYNRGLETLNGCRQHPRAAGDNVDVKVSETAVAADGSAWSRSWTSTSGVGRVSWTNHFYVLRQGRVVEWVVFSEVKALNGGQSPETNHDRDFLGTLEKKLAILTHS